MFANKCSQYSIDNAVKFLSLKDLSAFSVLRLTSWLYCTAVQIIFKHYVFKLSKNENKKYFKSKCTWWALNCFHKLLCLSLSHYSSGWIQGPCRHCSTWHRMHVSLASFCNFRYIQTFKSCGKFPRILRVTRSFCWKNVFQPLSLYL